MDNKNIKKALDARRRLDKDKKICNELIKCGFDEAMIDNLFGTITGVFWLFDEIKEASDQDKENQKIAKKARNLANLIKSKDDLELLTVEDPGIRKHRLSQEELYSINQIQSFMSVHRFLDSFADYIEAGCCIPVSARMYGLLKSRRGRNLLNTFTARFVHDQLSLTSTKQLPKQNILTASLVTTLLNLNPPMTNHDVTLARKNYGRRKYNTDGGL